MSCWTLLCISMSMPTLCTGGSLRVESSRGVSSIFQFFHSLWVSKECCTLDHARQTPSCPLYCFCVSQLMLYCVGKCRASLMAWMRYLFTLMPKRLYHFSSSAGISCEFLKTSITAFRVSITLAVRKGVSRLMRSEVEFRGYIAKAMTEKELYKIWRVKID